MHVYQKIENFTPEWYFNNFFRFIIGDFRLLLPERVAYFIQNVYFSFPSMECSLIRLHCLSDPITYDSVIHLKTVYGQCTYHSRHSGEKMEHISLTKLLPWQVEIKHPVGLSTINRVNDYRTNGR